MGMKIKQSQIKEEEPEELHELARTPQIDGHSRFIKDEKKPDKRMPQGIPYGES